MASTEIPTHIKRSPYGKKKIGVRKMPDKG
jgi:hypothetical protein